MAPRTGWNATDSPAPGSATQRHTAKPFQQSAWPVSWTLRDKYWETNVRPTASDGDVGRAFSILHRVHGALLEIGVHGDDERGRAHELGLRAQPRRLAAFLNFVPGFYQTLARKDDSAVGGPQMLLGPVSDGSHAFLHRRILHGEAPDAVVVAAALLLGAVDQVIVAAVGRRTERPGYQLGMNAVAVLDELDMLLGYGMGGMKRHRPRHAIFVVHGHPRVAVERVAGVGGNERIPRHDPLRDPPVIVAGIRIAPRANDQAAGRVEDVEGGFRGFRELRARGVPMEWVGGQIPAVQERNMAGIDAALDRLQVVALLPPLGGDAMRRGQMHPLEVRQRRLFLRRPHVGPDDSAQLHARVGLELDALAHAAFFRLRGQVHALAVHVVLPPVIRAAQPALLVAAEPQRHAAVGAELVDQGDSPLRIAEGNQLLSEQFHADGRAVALRQLPVEQRGYPVAPEQLAHRRAGAGAGEEFIHLAGQHGPSLLNARAPGRCRYRSY